MLQKFSLLFIILSIFTQQYSIVNADTGCDVQIRGERMTLQCRQTPLQEILHDIRRQGVSVYIDPDINPVLTGSFLNRPVETVFKSILKSYDYALIWEKNRETSALFLDEIKIFKKGFQSRMAQLKGTGDLDVVRDPATGALYVRDEILVRKPASMSASDFEKVIRSVGGTILEKDEIIGIYRIRLPDHSDVSAIAAKLNQAESGLRSEPNFAYPLQPSFQYLVNDKYLEKFDVASGTDSARGLPVAVLDSGMMAGVGLEEYAIATFDAVSPGDPMVDRLGHGTQMSLVAAGLVAPMGTEAEEESRPLPVIPIRAFDDNGVTSNFIMMRSIQFALENGARVINLSWGSETSSPFMESAINYASEKGMIVVASAGNEPTGQPVYPAAYDSVIGVGALSPNGKNWKYSNYGDFVSVTAPGFAGFPVGYKGEAGLYAGTSIASAYVSRKVSEYITQNPKATLNDVRNFLKLSGSK